MGFPIQKFPDQSLFAAPRNLSQRTTSFIASQRQGIHRIPLRHLIVLEIRKRTHQHQALRPLLTNPSSFFKFFEKTSFASNTSGNLRSGKIHDWYALVEELKIGNDLGPGFRPPLFVRDPLFPRDRMRFLFTMSIPVGVLARLSQVEHPSSQNRANRLLRRSKFSRDDTPTQNPTIFKLIFHRKRRLLTAAMSDLNSPNHKAGGARRDRTDDLMLAKHALSQLSYGPSFKKENLA